MAEVYFYWGRRARSRQADLLWPVEVHAVQVPSIGSGTNLFQQHLLTLLQAGVKDLHELARLSALDRQLVAFILAKELQPKRWIDHHFNLTVDGMAALEGRTGSNGGEQVMFAFWDQVSARWMPFLSDTPPEIFPLNDGAKHPRFLVDRDSGHHATPYILRNPRGARQAEREGLHLALRQFEREWTRDDEEDLQVDFSSLEFLNESPQMGYVWAQAYAVEDDLYPWLVSDPFHPERPDRVLRESLSDLVQSDPRLEGWLGQRLALRAQGDAEHDVAQSAMLRLEEQLNELVPPSRDPAVVLVRDYAARVLRLAGRLRSEAIPMAEDLSNTVVHSGSCLEALLQWMLKKWPADISEWCEGWDRRQLRGWLTNLPLTEQLNDSCVRALEAQQYRVVRLAALERNQPMKGLLVAALLSTRQHEQHPLRHGPVNALNWDLISLRNKGGHASSFRLERGPVLDFAEMSLRWIELFKNHY